MFGSVAGVAEGLHAAAKLTNIRLFTRVTPQVDLQVLQSRKSLTAAFKHAAVGLLSRVDPHVDEQFVAGVEGLAAANAAGPKTSEVISLPLVHVNFLNVPYQLVFLHVRSLTVHPLA